MSDLAIQRLVRFVFRMKCKFQNRETWPETAIPYWVAFMYYTIFLALALTINR